MSANNEGRRTAVALCVVLFFLFCYCFLFHYEGDLLATSQWVLSDRHTQYMPVVEPLMATVLLGIVAWAVQCMFSLPSYVMAMACAPSSWIVALLTNARLPMPDGHSNGFSWVGFAVWALAILLALNVLSRMFSGRNSKSGGSMAATVASNSILFVMLFGITVWASNTRVHLHNTIAMSVLAGEDKWDEVLAVGRDNAECSRSMCAMRALAMGHNGIMADKLFTYPQHHGALGLVSPLADSAYMYDWPHEAALFLGSLYSKDVETPAEALHYLRELCRRHPGKAQADYLLCAYLLERRLDDFAAELPKHYELDGSLPRHYKEALVVYQRRSKPPVLEYHDSETEANFAEFMNFRSKFSNKVEQEFHVVDMYHETYWCYYYYPTGQDK